MNLKAGDKVKLKPFATVCAEYPDMCTRRDEEDFYGIIRYFYESVYRSEDLEVEHVLPHSDSTISVTLVSDSNFHANLFVWPEQCIELVEEVSNEA